MNRTISVAGAILGVVACMGVEEDVSTRESAVAQRVGPPRDCCFFEGEVLTTVVPPSPLPNGGNDDLYTFVGETAEGQLPVSAVAPGQGAYDGGAWAVHEVRFQDGVEPTLLTSVDEVLAAEAAGELTIERTPEADFRCPVQ